jgi:hypothetical protein
MEAPAFKLFLFAMAVVFSATTVTAQMANAPSPTEASDAVATIPAFAAAASLAALAVGYLLKY